MYWFLKFKKFIILILTTLIWNKKSRKFARNFLFWFSIEDYIKFKNQNFHIVSLGANCLPRILTTAAKIKPRKIYGEKSCPFDLFISKDLEKIANVIENDFQNFFEIFPFNKDIFLHDENLSQEQFRHRYLERIKNFQDIMEDNKKIFFIYSNYDNPPKKETVQKLYKILSDKRMGKPFELILLTKNYISEIENVIQLPEDFKIEDPNWGVYILNQYGQYNNYYTDYTQKMAEKLKKVIH